LAAARSGRARLAFDPLAKERKRDFPKRFHGMLVNEEDDRFYVADSTLPGAGNGLFTKVPLRQGDRLEVVGVIVARDSISDRCTPFCDHHKFRIGEDRLLIPLGFGGMVNHSSTPNVRKVFEGDRLYLEALRDLAADEEVFFTYTPYAQQTFGLS